MAIEDLFKIVKERFVADQPAAPANSGGDVEIPQDLLFKCPRCGAVVYNREFTAAMKVCPKCNYHARLTWQERLELTADKESFQEFDADMKSLNPIGFPKYEDKIAKMQQQCDMNDAIKTGRVHYPRIPHRYRDHGFPLLYGEHGKRCRREDRKGF